MLKIISLFLLGVVGASAQVPTVQSVTFDGVSHSVARLSIKVSGTFYWIRTRYVQSPGTCTSGTGGTVQGSLYSNYNFRALYADADGSKIVLGGLTPGKTYQICPEVSADFSNWSTGFGVTLAMPSVPAVHPALPIEPKTFNTDYPDTTGYQVVNVDSACSNFTDLFQAAIQNQRTTGTIIQIAPGQICSGPYNLYYRAADVTQFGSQAVNTTNNSINVNGHGFTEGEGIIFGSSYGCVPGSLTNLNGGNCSHNGPIIPGQLYYVHVLDTNNFQVYNGSPTSGGTLIPLPDQGNGSELYVHWPRPLKWIIVRTATPDAQFTPEHVRTSPAWLPLMGILRLPAYTMTGALLKNTLVTVGNFDGNDMPMSANIRFMGLEFTAEPNNAAATSSDPNPWPSLLSTGESEQNIVVDRCYFHGLGTPHRVYNAIYWDGMNVGIIDSYMDNFEYFHSVYSGLSVNKVN
jgi:hypothetical protein